jgi:hypothetical protein
MDATRADLGFLLRFIPAAVAAKADRIRVADTVGALNPLQTLRLIGRLRSVAGETALDFHGHNDLGMATANTLMAIEAGSACAWPLCVSVADGYRSRAGPLGETASHGHIELARRGRRRATETAMDASASRQAPQSLLPKAGVRRRWRLGTGLAGALILHAAYIAPLTLAAAETPMPSTPTLLPAACLPRVADYTHMWWAEGFPAHLPGAPWWRVMQTGHYALVLDTETLRIPHFGSLAPAGPGYAAAGVADNRAWQGLPAADLALTITVNGTAYRGTAGGAWTAFGGPRLIESGRLLQRADVTDLVFSATDGTRLNVEARFETVAWPDRLALILAARPGRSPFPAGEGCFGRLGGGFGFDGTNHLEIPHRPELDPEQFTVELWAFVPADYRASAATHPWLLCKNGNEWAEGNYGIMLVDGRPRAILNIGGGRENMFQVDAQGDPALQTDAWNHLALSYDGDALRIYANGKPAGDLKVGRKRLPGSGGLAFGRRQDNSGDGYHFRGAIDEVRLYDRALTPAEVQARATAPETALSSAKPVGEWSFRAEGQAATTLPGAAWRQARLEVSLTTAAGASRQHWELPADQVWSGTEWREAALVLTPGGPQAPEAAAAVTVRALEIPSGAARPVDVDAARGWHRVNLDDIVPVEPPGEHANGNDAIERIKLLLTNPGATEQTARLLFEKNGSGMRVRLSSPITGVSAILRGADGTPTGIPVQLSKNWHGRPEGGVYAGCWFHGFSQVHLPPGATVELELSIVYGHWGGVAAASHAQLCLVGWGSNQLWDQSALGAWGESICYEPDQAQAQCAVLDVRPLMVRSMHRDLQWFWTHNVGGGDFFRYLDPAGRQVMPARMRTTYLRQGPVLTEVLYAGRTGDGRIEHQATVSLYRSDDIVRGVYRLRMEVKEPTEFSRFVIFQVGADSYSYTGERQMAVGNELGLTREWATQWGGDRYRTAPFECGGRVPWLSLHAAVPRSPDGAGAWANRGIVIRAWKARLGGQDAAPWAAEYGVMARGSATSTLDIVPPPGVTRFLPGDVVEATFEHIIMPQFAPDYYGPNAALRAALEKDANTWRLIQREAVGNDLEVEVQTGALEGRRPAVRIRVVDGRAEFALRGGLGYVPITLCGLRSWGRPRLQMRAPDGAWQTVDQAVHGNDFWQTDYRPESATWELTFSVPSDTPGDQRLRREVRFCLLE